MNWLNVIRHYKLTSTSSRGHAMCNTGSKPTAHAPIRLGSPEQEADGRIRGPWLALFSKFFRESLRVHWDVTVIQHVTDHQPQRVPSSSCTLLAFLNIGGRSPAALPNFMDFQDLPSPTLSPNSMRLGGGWASRSNCRASPVRCKESRAESKQRPGLKQMDGFTCLQ